jgi:multiple sugar transport system ATP-binding protein
VFDNMAFGLQMRGYARPISSSACASGRDPGHRAAARSASRASSPAASASASPSARAIVRHPEVFLFDEPLSNLDAKLRVQMRVELKRLHERLETTAIYVTHDQVEAMTLGTRVVVMKDGYVQQVGEPLELYGRPANRFVAGFIGSPAMNFVEVAISASGDALWAEAQGLRLKVPSHLTARLAAYGWTAPDPRCRPRRSRLANGGSRTLRLSAFTTRSTCSSRSATRSCSTSAPAACRWWRASIPGVRVKAHENIRLALDPERLHFFDAKTENAI